MATGCPSAPKYEICLLGEVACFCVDKRLPKEDQSYPRPYEPYQGVELDKWAQYAMTSDEYGRWAKKGKPPIASCRDYVATNADDFDAMQAYCKKGCKR